MRKQEQLAVLKAMEEVIAKRKDELTAEMRDMWSADGITGAEVDLNGRRLGKASLKRIDTTRFVVVDEDAFAPFADERFTAESIVIDAAKLPPEVLQMLSEQYGAVEAIEDMADWRNSVIETPAGVVTTDGEVVPGVVAVHDVKRIVEWRKDKGITAEDVLNDAVSASMLPVQTVNLLEGEVPA